MGILDNAKQVAKAVEEIHNLELYQRVLNLHSDIIELVEENNRLRDEVGDLKQKLELRAKMKFEVPFYFQEDDAIPHCAVCWEGKKQAIHVVKQWETQGETKWECPACKQGYRVGARRHHSSPGGHFDTSP